MGTGPEKGAGRRSGGRGGGGRRWEGQKAKNIWTVLEIDSRGWRATLSPENLGGRLNLHHFNLLWWLRLCRIFKCTGFSRLETQLGPPRQIHIGQLQKPSASLDLLGFLASSRQIPSLDFLQIPSPKKQCKSTLIPRVHKTHSIGTLGISGEEPLLMSQRTSSFRAGPASSHVGPAGSYRRRSKRIKKMQVETKTQPR